jgi:hypothetical protein
MLNFLLNPPSCCSCAETAENVEKRVTIIISNIVIVIRKGVFFSKRRFDETIVIIDRGFMKVLSLGFVIEFF